MERPQLNAVRVPSTSRLDDIAELSGARLPGRVASVDALRAIALIAMVVYHFCFDLRYFAVIRGLRARSVLARRPDVDPVDISAAGRRRSRAGRGRESIVRAF